MYFFNNSTDILSSLYPSVFKASALFCIKVSIPKQRTFQSVEHWVVYNKALFFKDAYTARQVLKEKSPKTVAGLGKKIDTNGMSNNWRSQLERVLVHGNYHKFNQNLTLRQHLMRTGTNTIVYENQNRLLGTGLKRGDPKNRSVETWNGENLCGRVLDEVRCMLATGEKPV